MITGEDPLKQKDFVDKTRFHLKRNIRFIQFRAKTLNESQYTELAKKILKETRYYDAKLILNCDLPCFSKVLADGIHLNSKLLMGMNERPLSHQFIVSAACHNAEQLMKAKQIGVDLVTLSPVLHTSTHPNVNPLGWEQFSQLCLLVDFPVYALGGMKEDDLETAISHGAYGLAAINSLW